MRIVIDSSLEWMSIYDDIAILTDKAKVCPESIRYDEKDKTVAIKIMRKNITRLKRDGLSLGVKPIYGKGNDIESIIQFKDVKNVEVKHTGETLPEFTMFFGVKMNNHEVYISSAEESQGSNVYEILITIDRLSFEFVDVK